VPSSIWNAKSMPEPLPFPDRSMLAHTRRRLKGRLPRKVGAAALATQYRVFRSVQSSGRPRNASRHSLCRCQLWRTEMADPAELCAPQRRHAMPDAQSQSHTSPARSAVARTTTPRQNWRSEMILVLHRGGAVDSAARPGMRRASRIGGGRNAKGSFS
jgi:hypothetical protein